jgi:hypothetical protein
MELSAKEYKSTLGEKQAFLVRSLAAEGKTIFKTGDASRLLGPGAKATVHRLGLKKWVLPLKRGLYAMVPLDVGVRGAAWLARQEARLWDGEVGARDPLDCLCGNATSFADAIVAARAEPHAGDEDHDPRRAIRPTVGGLRPPPCAGEEPS